MSADTYIFRRVEKKYLVKRYQRDALLALILPRLIPDEHGRSTVCSLYLDTPDHRLIRESIDAKNESKLYKEKLRLRSYGVPRDDSPVFFEMKKKFKGVVYKRRIKSTYRDIMDYIANGTHPEESQIMRELDYAMSYYCHPMPSVLICYEREAYFVKDIPSLRITFDTAVRYRCDELTPSGGDAGRRIIDDDTAIMEIKTDGGMPLWLASALDRCAIYPTSFSKYGTAYTDLLKVGTLNAHNTKDFIKGDNIYA